MSNKFSQFFTENKIKQDCFFEINPFLFSSKKALQLIASINEASGQNTVSQNDKWRNVDKLLSAIKFQDKIDKIHEGKVASDYFDLVYSELKMDSNSSYDQNLTRVVLGGEFSSGKSSFLNSLLCKDGQVEFLPVSEKSTSVVPTYIYCNTSLKEQTVIGENKNKGRMKLSSHALLALGHEFKRKHGISIGSFFNKLIIQHPVVNKFLDDFVFVDTPGYSREDGIESTDKNTAMESVKNGDVLFWMIDIESGTLKKQDLDFINKNFDKNKPIVIVFNKADKKEIPAVQGIVSEAAKILDANRNKSIIDIIAYSSHDKRIINSYRKYSQWSEIFLQIKTKAKKHSSDENFFKFLLELEQIAGDNYKSVLRKNNELISGLNVNLIDSYRSKSKEQNNGNKEANSLKSDLQSLLYGVDLMQRNFRELKKKIFYAASEGSKSHGIVMHCDNYEADLGELLKEINDILEGYSKIFNEKSDKKSPIEEQIEKFRDDFKLYDKGWKDLNTAILNIRTAVRGTLNDIKGRKIDDSYSHLRTVGVINPSSNVFEAVQRNDFELFLDCLSRKQNLTDLKYGSGYNLLNFAVEHQRYDMVNVLLPKAKSMIHHKKGNIPSAMEIAVKNNDTVMLKILNK